MKNETQAIFEELFVRYPALSACRDDLRKAYETLLTSYQAGGKVFTCGNGGSASDSEHIVGELLKKFKKHRDIPADLKAKLQAMGPEGTVLAQKLEGSLGAVSTDISSLARTIQLKQNGWTTARTTMLP